MKSHLSEINLSCLFESRFLDNFVYRQAAEILPIALINMYRSLSWLYMADERRTLTTFNHKIFPSAPACYKIMSSKTSSARIASHTPGKTIKKSEL